MAASAAPPRGPTVVTAPAALGVRRTYSLATRRSLRVLWSVLCPSKIAVPAVGARQGRSGGVPSVSVEDAGAAGVADRPAHRSRGSRNVGRQRRPRRAAPGTRCDHSTRKGQRDGLVRDVEAPPAGQVCRRGSRARHGSMLIFNTHYLLLILLI